MRIGGLSMVLAALALAACGSEPAQPPAQEPQMKAASEPVAAPVSGPERRILAFGDSLFAGYGLGEGEGYPEKLQKALRAKGINAQVADAGVSGDTTAAGLQRLAFVLDSQAKAPELAIVELGGNDLLRGISPAETRENLEAILQELAKRKIPVLLMGMRAPPNLGQQFVSEFDGIYPALARQYSTALVPFFLEPVYDKPQLIQADRIHPTAAGIDAMVAATVADVAKALPATQ
ncbi:arylesterase [Croceibacterium sp. LX-88]|uniref:Arylesterase n=2 Tax=Croceibacterium selenioxidans TaxID=2838833 RepID=A0ABS5W7Z7_9SPHN|nr:arylesterase [Croceibacterium selenioxidans]MBT2135873.1 arylesterase [Croceibacterium selenioxidans]